MLDELLGAAYEEVRLATFPVSVPARTNAPQQPLAGFSGYLDARASNQTLFLGTNTQIVQSFEVAARSSRLLGTILTSARDRNGKTHVGLAPFFLIFERATLAAFEALSTNQGFQAWVSVRPGIEAALIIGKWATDPVNASIWRERNKSPGKYRETYAGKALGKSILPLAEDIALALKMINDHYLHPNPDYVFRHLQMEGKPGGDVEMRLEFFDDSNDVALGVLGVTHLVVTIQDSLARMFTSLFVDTIVLHVGLDSLRRSAGEWARQTMRICPFYRDGLQKMGLWPSSIVT